MAIMEVAFDPQWGEAWNRRQVSDALVMPHTHAILLANDHAIWSGKGDAPVGFVMSRHAADEEELLLIGVVPEARGKGIGKALIKALFEHASARGMAKVFLEMRSNNPAEHLYRRMGFEPIGQRSDYYRLANGGRMDAITFARMLDT
ncbi:GNAT family N-acetyltransferase [Altererythrobacter sp. JGD-16]|uniref:GNAT family N-acetyltransferase n=2 Tax=Altererythrobacter lutimaris TaxID=2743979 RepID=A0A850HBD2_9SPHN|nr:GNAT family N-acetyltransferase [Altererythrobacter lutimaris]